MTMMTKQLGRAAPEDPDQPNEDRRLKALGIELLLPEQSPGIYAEYTQVARGIVRAKRQVVGLCPADADVGIPSFAVHLGLALANAGSCTVAYVDANVRWPAGRPLVEQNLLPAEEGREDFATLWLRGMLAVMVPREVGLAGSGVTRLRLALADARDLFGYVLVDMTGFHAIGDHLAVYDLVDGVVLVGGAGSSTERQLLDLETEIAADKLVGAVLVG